MRPLGDLESLVMERLWAESRPQTVRQVLEGLPGDRAYTTVMTVLDNLFKKNMVEREPEGRAYAYRAARTREEHAASLIDDALSASGDRRAVLMHFAEQLNQEEAASLAKALAKLRGPQGASS